jgi:hypothetical protein
LLALKLFNSGHRNVALFLNVEMAARKITVVTTCGKGRGNTQVLFFSRTFKPGTQRQSADFDRFSPFRNCDTAAAAQARALWVFALMGWGCDKLSQSE